MRWKSTGEAEINIGVLGSRNDVLWEFRDFLICLDAESDYKISMMFRNSNDNLVTFFHIMKAIAVGNQVH